LNTYKTGGVDVSNFENYLAPGKDEKNKYSVNIGVSRDQGAPGFTFDLYDGEKLVQSLPAVYKGVSGVANRNLNIPTPVSDVARRFTWNSKKENGTNSYNLLGFGITPYELMLQLLAKADDPFSGGRSYYSHPSLRREGKEIQ